MHNSPAPPKISRTYRNLRAQPMTLSNVRRELDSLKERDTFILIVDELLPDDANAILSKQSAAAQIEMFFEKIGERYFPVRCDETDGIVDMCRSDADSAWGYINNGAMPELFGYWIEEAHEFTETILTEYSNAADALLPILLGVGQVACDEDDGIRTTWRDAAASRFGNELIPEDTGTRVRHRRRDRPTRGSRDERLCGTCSMGCAGDRARDAEHPDHTRGPDQHVGAVGERSHGGRPRKEWQLVEKEWAVIRRAMQWVDDDPHEELRAHRRRHGRERMRRLQVRTGDPMARHTNEPGNVERLTQPTGECPDIVAEWEVVKRGGGRRGPEWHLHKTRIMGTIFAVVQQDRDEREIDGHWTVYSDFAGTDGAEFMSQLWARTETEALREAERAITAYWAEQRRLTVEKLESIDRQAEGKQRRLI